MSYLIVNGLDISGMVSTLATTHESIWSTNAGRALDATFVGDIVAYKWKLQVTTRALSQHENAVLSKALKEKAFFSVKFIPEDAEADEMKEITAYTNPKENTLYSYADGLPRYSGTSFNLIER